MKFELDHFFIFVERGFPDVSSLQSRGFNLDREVKHNGQGTASRFIFFDNEYLEFIWIDSEADALKNRLNLLPRTTGEASPFGICLRSKADLSTSEDFWLYSPSYAPGLKIRIHRWNESNPLLPLLFVMDTPHPSQKFASQPHLFAHSCGSTHIKKISLRGPSYTQLTQWVTDPRFEFLDHETANVAVALDGSFERFENPLVILDHQR